MGIVLDKLGQQISRVVLCFVTVFTVLVGYHDVKIL